MRALYSKMNADELEFAERSCIHITRKKFVVLLEDPVVTNFD